MSVPNLKASKTFQRTRRDRGPDKPGSSLRSDLKGFALSGLKCIFLINTLINKSTSCSFNGGS